MNQKHVYPFIAAHSKHLNKSQAEIDTLTNKAISQDAPADAYDFDEKRGGWQRMQDLRNSSPDLVKRFEREAGVTVDELLTEGANA